MGDEKGIPEGDGGIKPRASAASPGAGVGQGPQPPKGVAEGYVLKAFDEDVDFESPFSAAL